ncbi:DUF1858 domain-containing protein [Candidatus Uhrbacteria bacterium]|nr:DUF1858 domain-containing protein [Candidatus Uhrbacteria bacterium]
MQQKFVTKDMLLGTVVSEYPEAAEVMLEYGLHCVGCFANMYDTVEIGAKVHGMTEEEIEKMITDVNKRLVKEKKYASDK